MLEEKLVRQPSIREEILVAESKTLPSPFYQYPRSRRKEKPWLYYPVEKEDTAVDTSLPMVPHEKRSPFRLRNCELLSYLLFSSTRCDSVVGACRVGAGSLLDSWLGEPAASVRGGPPLFALAAAALAVATEAVPPNAEEERGRLGTLSEYSIDSIICFFLRWASNFAARSALMERLAKM
jgi:hypothetical protein